MLYYMVIIFLEINTDFSLLGKTTRTNLKMFTIDIKVILVFFFFIPQTQTILLSLGNDTHFFYSLIKVCVCLFCIF